MPSKSAEVVPLCQYLDGLVDELRRVVPNSLQEFDAEAVHKARVTTRRLKAALDLLRPVLHDDTRKPFAKLGRKLRRRMGPLRDADVMLGHLDEISEKNRLAPAAKWLRQRLTAERAEARAASKGKAPVRKVLSELGRWWALREDVLNADAAVPSLLAESVHLQLDRFVEQADQLAEKHDPHQLRIAGKLLRYTLELTRAQGRKLPGMVLKSFKAMQEHLGLWHDYAVLAERAMRASLGADLPLHDADLQKLVLDLIKHYISKAQRELERFASLWNERGGELVETIRGAFPLTEKAKAPQKDPDPSPTPSTPPEPAASTDQQPAA